MSEIKQTIEQLIRKTRRAKGFTQRELGDKLGVSELTVNSHEGGKQNLTVETLQKIAIYKKLV